MNNKELERTLATIAETVGRVVDPDIRAAFSLLFNLIESSSSENERYKKTIQDQKDEINRLKGEQGKPSIRPQKKDGADNHSSEKERKKRAKTKEPNPRPKKKDVIKADRSEVCKVDRSTLPADAEYKGLKPIIIQDIKIIHDNIEFQREVYYSKSLGKTFIAELPKGYTGEFGPRIRSRVISLCHDSNMSELAIEDFFKTSGIIISKTTISRMLTDKHDIFHEEKEDVIDAGLQATYQQSDDTSGRVNGKNHYVHILSNPFYTAYFTRPNKDRLTLLEIVCRGELKFTLNQESFQLMTKMGLSEKWLKQIKKIKQQDILTRTQIDTYLSDLFPNPKKQKANRRYILEAAALTYYYSLDNAIEHLMCDDAPQFNMIARYKSLCWIHEGRHYKKLRPIVPNHQKLLDNFSTQFWDFYQKLLDYSDNPTDSDAKKLEGEFDIIFSTKTGYDLLDERIVLTFAKKESLLRSLKFSFLPLHNNDAENGAQYQARSRDVHLQTRNEKGTKAKDTFVTIVKTARKLGVNVIDYIYDRISKKFSMPSLASLILEKCNLEIDTS